ncbi:MAG TPA: glycosyltransferase family 2 protein [Streptosporangiaceae bacterium]|nr:glycosyltransferase family 2 protein [Streptosporangiaceae bacterium]
MTRVMSPHDATSSAPASAEHLAAGVPEAVSVVMPVRNEERYIAESVGRILGQRYDGELELVIAVGPSRDRTAEVVRRLAESDSRIKVIDNPTGQIAAAINLALAASRHPVVVRVDGHSMLPDGYIQTAVDTLRETGAVNVGGMMAAAGITPFQQAVAWAMTSPFGVGAAKNHTGGEAGPADTAYMGVFRRSAIEQVGGYNEDFQVAEDWELNHRIRKAGGLIWFQPALRVTYRPRATVAELGIQYFRYGRWRRAVAREHAGTINLRYLAPPVAVALVAAGTLVGLAGVGGLAAGGWPGWLTLAFVLPGGYLAGILALAAWAATQLPPRATSRVPIALATMHMAWGAGFLTSPRSLVTAPSRPASDARPIRS